MLRASSEARAPMLHSATLDCAFQFASGPPQRPARASRPPLRKSLRIERHSPERECPPAICSPSAAMRRRRFGRSARQRSFDEGDTSVERSSGDSYERRPGESCECERLSLIDSEAKYHYDKTGLSTNDTNSKELLTPELCPDTNSSDKLTSDKHNSIRSIHIRGTSSDRIIAKKLKYEQKSASSLVDKTINSSGSMTSSIFEKHLSKFCKLSKLEKSKRVSTSALYDRSPTEAFYNKTGSARLSSQELFEKFCSEEFTSLYGREQDTSRYCAYHSKSIGSSGSDVYRPHLEWCHSKQDRQRTVENSRFSSPHKLSTSQSNLGAVKKYPKIQKKITERIRQTDQLDYSTDSDIYCASPYKRHKHKFTFDAPFSLPPCIHDIEDYETEDLKENIALKDHSLSAPLLSPSNAETRFTFDISEKSEIASNQDDTPSDATETRNLTLYEEPHSDRTSLSDFYDSCFSTKQSSFKCQLSRNTNIIGELDLTNLDFRAIDDESPNTSKYVSLTSPDDTIRLNSDSKSWYSDSVFTTPEKKTVSQCEEKSNKSDSLQTCKVEINMITERSDSTTVEDEPGSVIDRIPEIYIENFKHLSLESENAESCPESGEKTLTPHSGSAVCSKSVSPIPLDTIDSNNLRIDVAEQTVYVSMCSRPSMQKLEPIYPRGLQQNPEVGKDLDAINQDVDISKLNESYQKVLDPPDLKTKREKGMFFRLKKVRDASSVRVHKQSRCFPL